MFEIKAIQADQGDALLVSYGSANAPRHLLIDGGMSRSIVNVLTVLESARQDGHLRLEALIVTHYDLDHIEGIIELLDAKPEWLEIADIWFNGQKHLQPLDVLGKKEGDRLTQLIVKLQLPWNAAFKRRIISNEFPDPVPLAGGMNIWVLSPDTTTLQNLALEWTGPTPPADNVEENAPDLLGKKDTWPVASFGSYARAQFRADTSVPNGSSIAVMLEYGDNSMLLTGDAFSSVVENGMERRWQLPRRVDLLKISHHGSKANTRTRLLEKIVCLRYLFSTSGEQHLHPDQAMVARLLDSHPGAELIFNYRQPQTLGWESAPQDWPIGKLTFPNDGEPFVRVRLI